MENPKPKSRFPLSLKVAIPVLAIMLISAFVLANSAGGTSMVTLAFPTSGAPNESIWISSIYFQVPNGTTIELTSPVLATPISVPANTILLNMTVKEFVDASRYNSAFKPDTDTFLNITYVAPNATVVRSVNWGMYVWASYNSSDADLGIYTYTPLADHYMMIGGDVGGLTLTTGTWVIYLTTYTQ